MKTLVLIGLFVCSGFQGMAISDPDTVAFDKEALELEVADMVMMQYFENHGLLLDSCAYRPLYREAFDWIGVRYHFGGKSRYGIDCSSLVKNIYSSSFNIPLHGTARTLFDQCDPIGDQDELQEGDFLFFKIKKKHISHIALYLGDGYFVHASVSRGVMINRLSETYYKKYFFKGGRLKAPTPPF